MPFMEHPGVILEPPKRHFDINPPEVRREYGPKEQKDASEDIYDQAIGMARVLNEYEKILFKELTVEDDGSPPKVHRRKVKKEKR
uniref:Uncharacterized protein n=1 Tax=Panagrolaimus sp. JU765 TaxID=591449 RepID=A0AC34R5D5_9BILA